MPIALPAVLVRYVGGFLCWLDCMALRNTNHYALKCFDPSFRMTGSEGFRAILVKRLNTLGVDGEGFCSLLKEHKCVISGSLVLQCMLSVSWRRKAPEVTLARERMRRSDIPWPAQLVRSTEDSIVVQGDELSHHIELKHPMLSDIDIFQMGRPCPKEEKAITAGGPVARVIHNCLDSGCYPHDITFASFTKIMPFAIHVGIGVKYLSGFARFTKRIASNKWVCMDHILNVVTLNPLPKSKNTTPVTQIAGYIGKYFDFNFLKTVFDGTRLYIHDMDSIMSRRCTIDVLDIAYPCDIWDKYREDIGYVSPPEYPARERIKRIVQDRILKYRARGFDIVLNHSSTP